MVKYHSRSQSQTPLRERPRVARIKRNEVMNPLLGGGSRASSAFGQSSQFRLSYITPPPDLSQIPSEVSVPFKNLLKKDSITKAKALEDIVSYVRKHPTSDEDATVAATIPDSVLAAWVDFYPRTSIESSRRVRELSHTILLELAKRTQGRMKRMIATIIGPWLAGSFDKDKAVAKAASAGFETIAPTEQKRSDTWNRAQPLIMDYALEAIKETRDSLSDEKWTTKEDSEAKFYRVVGGSMALVTRVIQTTDFDKVRQKLNEYLKQGALWQLASAEDSTVRRSLYSLIGACLAADVELLRPHLGKIGLNLTKDALKGNQSASALDLLRDLTRLTELFPEIWGVKKSPYELLLPFVEKGSQGSSREYWMELRNLVVALPRQAPSSELSAKFLEALRKGISRRDEPPAYSSYAWSCYLSIFEKLFLGLAPDAMFLQKHIFPLTEQFLFPSPELAEWTSACTPHLLSKSWAVLFSHPDAAVQSAVQDGWESLASLLVHKLESSAPAVSKRYEQSQELVGEAGQRWFDLASAILQLPREQDQEILADSVTSSCLRIINVARDTLIRRDFKPFGAASVLKSASAKCPSLLEDGKLILSVIPIGDSTALENLVTSSSLTYVVDCLEQLAATQPVDVETVWNELIVTAIGLQNIPAVHSLAVTPSAKRLARRQQSLLDYLAVVAENCARGNDDDKCSWELIEKAIEAGIISDTQLQRLAKLILSIMPQAREQDLKPPLRTLRLLAEYRPVSLSKDPRIQLELATNILAVLEMQPSENTVEAIVGAKAPVKDTAKETVRETATYIRRVLDEQSSSATVETMQIIITKNLQEASLSSLKIPTLLHEYITLRDPSVRVAILSSLVNRWTRELTSLLEESLPDPSLALTSLFGSASILVEKPATILTNPPPERDAEGRSIPARMALFVSKLLSSFHEPTELPMNLLVELLYLLGVTIEVAEDQMTLAEDGLWAHISDKEVIAELELLINTVMDILRDIEKSLTTDMWKAADLDAEYLLPRLVRHMIQVAQSCSPLAFYSSKFLSRVLGYFSDFRGIPTNMESWLLKGALMRMTPRTIFPTMAFLFGFRDALADSPSVARLCKGLSGSIAGLMPGVDQDKTDELLRTIMLLNACMSVYKPDNLPVQNRIQAVMFGSITAWMETPDKMSAALSAEALKVILKILPNVKGLYGDYWGKLTSYCLDLWNNKAIEDPSNESLSYLHASIKLWIEMESVGDASEDLVETLADCSEKRSRAWVGLLKRPREPEMLGLAPYNTFDEILCRAVKGIPLEHVKDNAESLYPLIASASRSIQTAAFGLLRPITRASQEEIALEFILQKEKEQVDLPQGLLSLLSEAPTLDEYQDDLDQFPTPVRSYLLSWHLIFDAYSTAPQKLRDAYTDCIKKRGILKELLDFMFDVLGHSAAAALNLDKEGLTTRHVQNYDIEAADSEKEEKNMHWLLVHLCYLVLTYLSGPFRMWYFECSSRQTKLAVEAWIRKFLSPLLIAESLDQVVKWDSEQEEPAENENRLEITISRLGREVIAKYEIEDESAGIVISLPTGYPLETVDVRTWNRVAVDEKRWKGWLATTQGIITFANGSIGDGLAAFRSNIVGDLKGQTECAICYSIVATDKRLPDKRCGTCNHLFHGVCLFKWIQTSGSNTCPLCRNPINLLTERPRR